VRRAVEERNTKSVILMPFTRSETLLYFHFLYRFA
jgi:hypothetical protein